MTDPRRALPSVDRLLQHPAIVDLLAMAPRNLVVAAVRAALAEARAAGVGMPPDWTRDVGNRVARRSLPSLHPLLNATGVVLHTNLGRAPLAEAALRAIQAVGAGYSSLELDGATGARGSRADHCASLLAELTGAEAGLAVNNAAGALVLALNAVAAGKDVIISRGELIEIGGSFRIPDILEKSGAVLREVGTTNRTHLADYRKALSSATGAILIVHRSNFEQQGFVASPESADIAAVAREAGVPCLYDVGSGLLADLSGLGLAGEPRVQDAVRAGADLVVFSGDKLLGGPQAGCLVGRASLIEQARKNPFARALRADKLTLAALEATLALYRDPAVAMREIPVLRMLSLDTGTLAARARVLLEGIGSAGHPALAPGFSTVGGGSFPASALPTTLVSLDPGAAGAQDVLLRLRLGTPAIIARVENGRIVLDPRTLPEHGLADVGAAVRQAFEAA